MKIGEAVESAERTLVQLRALAARHPELELTRNPVGNYSVMAHIESRAWDWVEDWGYVDIFGEGLVLDGDPE